MLPALKEPEAYEINPQAAYPLHCNVPDAVLYANVQAAVASGLPVLTWQPPHERIAIVVGGGPSAESRLDQMRAHKAQGHEIYALNGAGRWLVENGIVPYAVVVMDARADNVRFVKGLPPGIKYFIASQCSFAVFAALENEDVTVWHPNLNGKSGVVENRATVFIGGGSSVGIRTLSILHVMGYRETHIYGLDSSYTNKRQAYAQPEDNGEILHEVIAGGKKYYAPPWMIRQADDFQHVAARCANDGHTFIVHGDGLLPYYARKLEENQRPIPRGDERRLLTAVYDLHLCPASYDFIDFLCLAEQRRRKMGADGIRVVIAPGPNQGFRDDLIEPTDADHRRQMLWNIVVPACRLVPSVASVSLCASRHELDGIDGDAVFPLQYHVDWPLHQYGFMNALQGWKESDMGFFSAPRAMLKVAATLIPPGTITITLRETPYGAYRNSNLDEWIDAAVRLRGDGYNVVFLRDTEHAFEPISGFVTMPAASLDIALRLAVYETAALNLFIANGPSRLAQCDPGVRLAIFRMVDNHEAHMSERGWAARGFPVGSQFPHIEDRCRLVWDDDRADIIYRVASDMMVNKSEPRSA